MSSAANPTVPSRSHQLSASTGPGSPGAPSGPTEPGGPQVAPEQQPGGIGVLEREVEATPRTSHGEGDHERFAHYVKKEKILESALSGDKVTALCGKKWIPGRDPGRFPVCPTCKEIFSGMPTGGDDDGDGTD